MIKEVINKLVNKVDLTSEETKWAFEEIMSGKATDAQISAFITALRMKGETISEITSAARVLRDKAVIIKPDYDVLDNVGTGGDEVGTFNISTISAIVISACGVKVAKHGNRAVSSKTGSADLLETLGVKLDIPASKSLEILDKIGICFLFAQSYHPSMKYAAPVRRETGIRSIFNIIGPLSNPASATLQVLGVYDKSLVKPLIQVLHNLGLKKALVVHGDEGLDEISTTTTTTAAKLFDGKISYFTINPKDYDIQPTSLSDLLGGDAIENAQIARNILNGELGPKRDAVLLTSAFSINLYKPELSINQCLELAAKTIDSSKALEQLEKFIELTNA